MSNLPVKFPVSHVSPIYPTYPASPGENPGRTRRRTPGSAALPAGTLTVAGAALLILAAVLGGCVSLSSSHLAAEDSSPGTAPWATPWATPWEADGSGPEQWESAGTLSVEARSWNWFFASSPEERLRKMLARAEEAAAEAWGPEARVQVRFAESRWHPLSLVMLLDLLGFVEETRLEFQVWVPAGREAPEPRQRISQPKYRVEPREDYTTASEFTLVTYKSALQLLDDLQLRAAEESLTERELELQKNRIPAGGIIYITLGRAEAQNAISRWFLFTLEEGGKRHFRRRGIEDIPYIPGGDRLWWNDLEFEVKDPWTSPLDLTIQDDFLRKTYYYQVIREEDEL